VSTHETASHAAPVSAAPDGGFKGGAEGVSLDGDLARSAAELFTLLRAKKLSVVTAESCTAGLVATTLSDAPGAAELLHGGFVTYTKTNKTCALGVPAALIAQHGAVSREVAIALAIGALERCPADLAVAVTGVAGPDPDVDGNPVGLVYFAVAQRGRPSVGRKRVFPNFGRASIRSAAAREAVRFLTDVAAHAEGS
jgi:nicotinamide-nucleotide amidase